MSLEPEELAIRLAFEHRDAAGVPAALWERLDRIPDEVEPLRPLPVRLALGLAPWVAVIAAGLVLAFGPRYLAATQTGTGGPAGSTWSAADPGGGFATIGVFGVPWAPVAIYVAIVGALAAATRVIGHGGTRPGGSGGPGSAVPRPSMSRGCAASTLVVLMTFLVANLLLAQGGMGPLAHGDMVVTGSVAASGPEVAEVMPGGIAPDEVSGLPGATVVERYVYRVGPGEAFAFVVSVKNLSPLPITILGLPADAPDAVPASPANQDYLWNGLGLLRDPTLVSAAPPDVVPFHPVNLASGDEVTLVVAAVGGACADPAGEIPPTAVTNTDGLSIAPGARGMGIVYDLLGWRVHGSFRPLADVVVPVRPGCVSSNR